VSQLLAALPADLELALVVVVHLDPTHESSLVELLARTTKLVVEVGLRGRPGARGPRLRHPPNANLTLAEGRLHLVPRGAGHAPHLPVDLFFASLAKELGNQAIGVILSGTGGDGTAGAQAIQRALGLTFAQDASARFEGMPASAVAAGAVSNVLSRSKSLQSSSA
jgi:two-component system CheB/CheR fusion protein